MDDQVDPVFRENGFHEVPVREIAGINLGYALELHAAQMGGKPVEDDDVVPVGRVRVDPFDEVRSQEAEAAEQEDGLFHICKIRKKVG